MDHTVLDHVCQNITAGTQDLFEAVRQCQTNAEALQLCKLAAGLRNELDRVVAAALEAADANTGN